jgi:hypothetical protein
MTLPAKSVLPFMNQRAAIAQPKPQINSKPIFRMLIAGFLESSNKNSMMRFTEVGNGVDSRMAGFFPRGREAARLRPASCDAPR